jgi:YD repeat-containing protein
MRHKSVNLVLLIALIAGTLALTAAPAAEATSDPYADAVTASTPNAWWRLNEASGTTVADSSGSGRTATSSYLSGEAAPGWPGVGSTDRSMRIEGDGAVTLPSSIAADTSTTAYSAECWVYVARLPAAIRCFSVGGIELGIGKPGSPSASATLSYTGPTPGSVSASAQLGWNHLVGIFDNSASKMRIYTNGALGAQAAYSSSYMTKPTAGGFIGAGGSLGRVDEVAHYKRVLTATEIADHYNAGLNANAPVTIASSRRVFADPATSNHAVRLTWTPYTGFTPTGYRILRDGDEVTNLDADVTEAVLPDPTMSGGWSVVAYNATSESADTPAAQVSNHFRLNTHPNGDRRDLAGTTLVDVSADHSVALWRSTSALTGETTTSGRYHLFVENRAEGTMTRLNAPGGVEPNAGMTGTLSADGRFVGVVTTATNLGVGGNATYGDAFRWNPETGKIDLLSGGLTYSTYDTGPTVPQLSADGGHAIFSSAGRIGTNTECSSNVSRTGSKVYAVYFPQDGTPPVQTFVTTGVPATDCPAEVKAISDSGRFVLAQGTPYPTNWLIDRDPDGDGDYDEPSNPNVRSSAALGSSNLTSTINGDGVIKAATVRDTGTGAELYAEVQQIHATATALFVRGTYAASTGVTTTSIVQTNSAVVTSKPSLSADGRYLAYGAIATAPGVPSGMLQPILVDRDPDGDGVLDGTTTTTQLRYPVVPAATGDRATSTFHLSADGRFLVGYSTDQQYLQNEDSASTGDYIIWDLRPGEPVTYGYMQSQSYAAATQGYVSDPINAGSGNFLHSETLLDFNGPAAALTATANYAHQDPYSGGLGLGWSSATDMRVRELDTAAGALLDLRTANGDHALFRQIAGEWKSITPGDTTSVEEASGGWERTHTDGSVETFDEDGWWTSTEYPDGSSIDVTRNSSGQATHVEHSTGYGYDLTWTSGRVTKLEADDGRTTTLHYTAGIVDTITRSGFRSVLFDHDDHGRITNIIQADGRAQRSAEFTRSAHPGSGTSLTAGNWTPSRTAITAETWFKLDAALPGGAGTKVLISKHATGGTTGEYRVALLNSGGVQFTTRTSTTSADDYNVTAPITPGVPHHLVATWNGTTKRIYLDGVEIGAGKAWTGTLATTTQPTRLSVVETTGTNQGFVGTLDDTALYATALSATQVAKHYQLGSTPVPGENYADDGPLADGAAAFWRFNGLRNEIGGAPALTGTVTYDDGLLVDNTTTRRLLTTRYDKQNRATGQTNSSGGETEIDYKVTPTSSSRPNVTESTDAVSGDVTRFEMLANGTVSQETAADGTTRARTVTDGRLKGITQAGATLTMAHDPITGVLNEVVRADGSSVEFTYDAADRPVAVEVNGDTQLTFDYATPDSSTSARTDRFPVTATDALGKTSSFTYDTVGGADRLVSTTDPDGVETTYSHDGHGQLTSATLDPAGADLETDWTYTAAGQIETVTLPGDRTWTYAYDAAGRVTSVTDPAGENATSTYTVLGDLATSTDRNGAVTHYTWRADGLLESVTDPDGVETSYGYNGNGELTSTTNAAGTTTFELGPMQRIDKATDPTGLVTAYTYDAQGRILTATKEGAAGSGDDLTTTYTYDPAGNLLTVTDPEGGVTTRTYTATSKPATETDPTGVVTSWGYDDNDRVITETIGGATTTTAYTSGGRLASVIDPDGVLTDYDYDTAGRLATIDVEGAVTELTYDSAGDLAERSDAGAVTTYERDELGQVTASNGPTGPIESTFDAEGNVTSYTRGAGDSTEGTWTYDYTAAGRLASVVDPVGTESVYAYDAAGLEHTRTVEGELQASKTYDPAGRLTIVDRLASGETTYTYDVYGQLATATDASGRTTTFTRDGNGRTLTALATATGLPTLTTTNTYDEAGRPTSVTDAGGTSTWTWATEPAAGPGDPEPTGLLVSRLDPNGELTYGWTDAGRMASRTVAPATGPPQTEEFTYTDGRLTSREDASGTSTYTWDDGRLVGEELPGLDRTRTYDTDGRLTSTIEDDGTDETTRTMAYDAWGRPSEATTGTETTTWSYDDAGQLVAETYSGTSTRDDRTWTYANGRLTADTTGSESRTWTWDDGRAVSVDIDSDTVELTYDAAGRQTGWSGAGIAVTRTYAAAGNVTAVTRNDGTTVTDETRTWHNGQLASVYTDDGATTVSKTFWHDDGNLAAGPSTLTDPILGALTAVVATADTAGTWTLNAAGPLTGGPGGANAPPTASVDLFGSLAGLDADAYGSGTTADGAGSLGARGAQLIGIGGLDLDTDAPVVHIGARDSDAGLFTTPDPLDAVAGTADSANAYAAHGNAPTVTWDTTGLRPDYGNAMSATEALEYASLVPGLDTFTDPALCGIYSVQAINKSGARLHAAASCASVLAVGVGAGHLNLIADHADDALRHGDDALEHVDEAWDAVSHVERSTSRNAELLAENLGPKTMAGDEAHHLVQSNAKSVAPSRSKLEQLGMDINDADNGVWLPGHESVRSAGDVRVIHRGGGTLVHGKKYRTYVADIVDRAASPSELRAGLDDLRQAMLRGETPWV